MGSAKKLYQRRRMSKMMAQSLLLATRYALWAGAPYGYIHFGDFLIKMYGDDHLVVGKPGGDYAKLKHWYVIQPMFGKSSPGNKHAGMWQILKLAHDFINKETELPRYITIKDGERTDASDATIGIVEAVGGELEYQRLMAIDYSTMRSKTKVFANEEEANGREAGGHQEADRQDGGG